MSKYWKVLRHESKMKECTKFDWQNDNWTSVNTEQDEVWDLNLFRNDETNECCLVFYPTFINSDGIRQVDTSGYAKFYKVVEQSEDADLSDLSREISLQSFMDTLDVESDDCTEEDFFLLERLQAFKDEREGKKVWREKGLPSSLPPRSYD